jgi:putative phage-type endonuclease
MTVEADLGAPVAGGKTGAPARQHASGDRTEWLRWRRGGIGASDIAGIAGVSPWASPWSVWVDKVGLVDLDDDDASDQMILGQDLEPVIIRWFERRRRGLWVAGRQFRAVHPELDWARATLDGLILEEGSDALDSALAVFESKYDAGSRWDEIPEHYRLQVQWQLFVTGLDVAELAVMHMAFGRPRFEIYEVPRDQRLIGRLVKRAERFWTDHVAAGVPPLADGHRATTAALADAWIDPEHTPAVNVRSLEHVVDELRGLRAARKELDADIERDENLLKAALGTYTEGCIDGQVVVSWRQQSRTDIDRDAVRADHGDKYDRHGTVRVLRLHTPRATRRIA